MSAHNRHLDADALAKLAGLQLRVNAVVDGTLAGLHRRPHHGSSIEFAEHKEYAPGDDTRHLDWKVFARFDRYYIRQYEDETELKAYLLVDHSGSMGYGEPLAKLEYASVLAGSLAYLLARQRDQPGLLAFADQVTEYVPPRSRSGQIAALLGTLDKLQASGGTDLGRAVSRIVELAGRRSLVIFVSDLLDVPPAQLKMLRHLRRHNHQVVLFHLLHDDELSLPFKDITLFEAMESNNKLLVDPTAIRNAYRKEIEAFIGRVEGICREGEILYERVCTTDPIDALLLRLIHQGRRGSPLPRQDRQARQARTEGSRGRSRRPGRAAKKDPGGG